MANFFPLYFVALCSTHEWTFLHIVGCPCAAYVCVICMLKGGRICHPKMCSSGMWIIWSNQDPAESEEALHLSLHGLNNWGRRPGPVIAFTRKTYLLGRTNISLPDICSSYHPVNILLHRCLHHSLVQDSFLSLYCPVWTWISLSCGTPTYM